MGIVQDDVIQATVIQDNDTSGEVVNRYHFRMTSGEEISDENGLDDIAEIIAIIYDIVKSIISLRTVLREVGVYNLTQIKLLGSTDANAYTGGVGTDPAAPQGVAYLAYFKTNVPRVILSKYIPTPTTGSAGISGLLTAASLTLMTSFAARLILPFTQTYGDWEYGHWNKVLSTWTVPTLAVTTLTPAYQRRRKPGRGS